MHRWPYRKFQGVIVCYEYVSRVLKVRFLDVDLAWETVFGGFLSSSMTHREDSFVAQELVDEFSTQVTDMDEEQRRVFAREKNQEFMRLKAASEELMRDLDSMEKYATGLVRTMASRAKGDIRGENSTTDDDARFVILQRERFLRMGCVCDECTVNNAAALDFNKIRRKVYKHRMMLANYTKDIIKNTLK